MVNRRKLWSSTLVAGLGLLFSPFAAIVLQAINYSSLDQKAGVRGNLYWFIGLFLGGLVWAELPLPLSSQDRLAASIAYSATTFLIWFISYSRPYIAREMKRLIQTTAQRGDGPLCREALPFAWLIER